MIIIMSLVVSLTSECVATMLFLLRYCMHRCYKKAFSKSCKSDPWFPEPKVSKVCNLINFSSRSISIKVFSTDFEFSYEAAKCLVLVCIFDKSISVVIYLIRLAFIRHTFISDLAREEQS
jgi:hypothetical protein